MGTEQTNLLNVLKKFEQLIEETRKKWEETCDPYFEGKMDAFDYARTILSDALGIDERAW